MELLRYTTMKILYTLPILFGVTFLSFLLMVYFGSDTVYSLLGKNATLSDVDELRKQLGYDLGFFKRYLQYLKELFTFDFGRSTLNYEKVSDIFKASIPISLALNLPGFIIGNLLAIILSLYAALNRGLFVDKVILFFSSVGMSTSFIMVILGLQYLLCTSSGWNLFPVHGWNVTSFSSYVEHVFVPSLASIFVSLGYNTRFFRAVVVEELKKPYVKTCLSLGYPRLRMMGKWVLKNTLIPMSTRIVFSIPFIFVEGSLLLESFFGIPGMGLVLYDALVSGDLPILKAIVGLGTVIYIFVLVIADIFYKFLDPRVTLS